MSTYTCTKRFPEICVAHRNHKAKSHCSFVHGYARTVELTFEGELDENGWVLDYGNLKNIRHFLNEQWDHRLLLSDDDPLLEDFKALEKKGAVYLNIMDSTKGHSPTIEGSCKFVADFVKEELKKQAPNVRLIKVEIWEKTDNRSALLLK